MNVLFEPSHVKFMGENTRRESIPYSRCATEERTILKVSRAMSHRIDVESMNGPGKSRLPVKCTQRWHKITNFTRVFTVKISVKQRQASHVPSMAQGSLIQNLKKYIPMAHAKWRMKFLKAYRLF